MGLVTAPLIDSTTPDRSLTCASDGTDSVGQQVEFVDIEYAAHRKQTFIVLTVLHDHPVESGGPRGVDQLHSHSR